MIQKVTKLLQLVNKLTELKIFWLITMAQLMHIICTIKVLVTPIFMSEDVYRNFIKDLKTKSQYSLLSE